MKYYDIVIAGGGPAGAAAGVLLARAGFAVAILERDRFPRSKVCGEYLSPAALAALAALGIADDVLAAAGPAVERVTVLAGDARASADLPAPCGGTVGTGRALAREHLDQLLLARAAQAGAHVCQPCRLRGVSGRPGDFRCDTTTPAGAAGASLRCAVVIAAHGSAQPGPLATRPPRGPRRNADLLAFKAHFAGAAVPAGEIVVLGLAGGYAGLVRIDGGRSTFACCIRRDALARWRSARPGMSAGEALLDAVLAVSGETRRMMAGAIRQGAWLVTGPLQPGVRLAAPPGVFRVGNAAGEVQPIVGEGIGMALHSAHLLCALLRDAGAGALARPACLQALAEAYGAAWRRAFAGRLRAAAAFACLAMHPAAARATTRLLERLPALLTAGARLSGKGALPLQPWSGSGSPSRTNLSETELMQ